MAIGCHLLLLNILNQQFNRFVLFSPSLLSSPQLFSSGLFSIRKSNSQNVCIQSWLFFFQGSTWILLARKLNYRIGGLNVIPEQINFLNPLLILILVPIFEGIVYPLARKVGMESNTIIRKDGLDCECYSTSKDGNGWNSHSDIIYYVWIHTGSPFPHTLPRRNAFNRIF